MAELRKIGKIRRSSYRFSIKRRFSHVKRYRAKEVPLMKRFLDGLKKGRQAAVSGKAPSGKPRISVSDEPQAPKGTPLFLKIAVLVLLLMVVGIAGIGLLALSLPAQGGHVTTRVMADPELSLSPQGGGVTAYGDESFGAYAGYLNAILNTRDMADANARFSIYDTRISNEVFILVSQRDQAQNYEAFKANMKRILSQRKIPMNEIDLEQLKTLPKDAIIIVPSGVIPEELLTGDTRLQNLLSKGCVVIYMGLPFDRMLTKEKITVSTPQAVLSQMPLTFEKGGGASNGISLYQPLYRVGGAASLYGSLSMLNYYGGTLVFFPETLDGGWRDNATGTAAEFAAEDVAKVISGMAWVSPVSSAGISLTGMETGVPKTIALGVFPSSSEKYVLIQAEGRDINEEPVYETRIARITRLSRGDIYVYPGSVVLPSPLSGEKLRLTVRLAEPKAYTEDISVEVLKDGKAVDKITFPQSMSTQGQVGVNYDADLAMGDYILRAVNPDGRIFAEGFLSISNISIADPYYDRASESYVFRLTSTSGQPVSAKSITVVADDGKLGRYSSPGGDSISINLVHATGSKELPPGAHVFQFEVNGQEFTKRYEVRASSSMFTEPWFLAGVGLALLVFVAGLLLRRGDISMYQLDIPDFPALEKNKIPVTVSQMLAIFRKVNEAYQWERTPLTLGEVKNGFVASVDFKGQQVYISDYNLSYILERLGKKGLVKESLGYYSPAEWEKESGESAEFLSMFRRLRDIGVNNAVPFTQKGEAKDCDSILDILGQEISVFMYYKGREKQMLELMLGSVHKGISIVVFANDDEKMAFMNSLHSSSGVKTYLKMEIDGGDVHAMTFDELEKFVKEMKA
ncbi:MAG: hypothetical protein ACP5NX_03660 [Candidatus Bilamarchaeaceae archaeon]